MISILDEAQQDGIDTSHLRWVPVYHGLYDSIPDFVARGADVNGLNASGMTPLMNLPAEAHFESKADPFKCATLLLALGADKEARDSNGITAIGHFHWTVFQRQTSSNAFRVNNGFHRPRAMIDALMPADVGAVDRLLVNLTHRCWSFANTIGYAFCNSFVIHPSEVPAAKIAHVLQMEQCNSDDLLSGGLQLLDSKRPERRSKTRTNSRRLSTVRRWQRAPSMEFCACCRTPMAQFALQSSVSTKDTQAHPTKTTYMLENRGLLWQSRHTYSTPKSLRP